jgi:hypothetical protein
MAAGNPGKTFPSLRLLPCLKWKESKIHLLELYQKAHKIAPDSQQIISAGYYYIKYDSHMTTVLERSIYHLIHRLTASAGGEK